MAERIIPLNASPNCLRQGREMRPRMAIYHIVRALNQENGGPTIFDLLTACAKIYKFLSLSLSHLSSISLCASREQKISPRDCDKFLSIKSLVGIKPLRKIIFRRKISKSVPTGSTYFQVISFNPSREERLLFYICISPIPSIPTVSCFYQKFALIIAIIKKYDLKIKLFSCLVLQALCNS